MHAFARGGRGQMEGEVCRAMAELGVDMTRAAREPTPRLRPKKAHLFTPRSSTRQRTSRTRPSSAGLTNRPRRSELLDVASSRQSARAKPCPRPASASCTRDPPSRSSSSAGTRKSIGCRSSQAGPENDLRRCWENRPEDGISPIPAPVPVPESESGSVIQHRHRTMSKSRARPGSGSQEKISSCSSIAGSTVGISGRWERESTIPKKSGKIDSLGEGIGDDGEPVNMFWPIRNSSGSSSGSEAKRAFLKSFISRNTEHMGYYRPELEGLDEEEMLDNLSSQRGFEAMRRELLLKEQRLCLGQGSLGFATLLHHIYECEGGNGATLTAREQRLRDRCRFNDPDPFRASLSTSRQKRDK
ncbi:unnamed protein product [Chrysoparadoxa australica]